MGYSYSGVVDGLKEFYSSMRKLNIEIGTFEHTYSGIVSWTLHRKNGQTLKCKYLIK